MKKTTFRFNWKRHKTFWLYVRASLSQSGLNSMGVWVQLTGPLPTPGIGFLAQNMRVSAGVVISASHNPYYDNGIKIFFSDGFKISREEEKEIEDLGFFRTNCLLKG